MPAPYVDSSGNHRFAELDDGTSNNVVTLSETQGANKAVILNTNSVTYAQNSLNTAANTLIKGAVAYNSSAIYAAFNATAYTAGGASTIPTMNTLNVGSGNGGTNYFLDGWVNRIWYMPTQQPSAAVTSYTQ